MGEYYGSWNREQLLRINRWIQVDIDLDTFYVDLYKDSRWLDRLLAQFPQADEDGDGRITAEEAVRWHGLRMPLLVPGAPLMAWLPQGVSHWKEMVPAHDGAMLATQVYLPAGEGPFPTLVGRGIRKGGQLDGAHWYLAKGFACVSQDLVPEGEELVAGAHGARARASRDIAADTYKLVEWVARQPWCSGQIALFGYSAGGMATLPVLSLRPPSLKAIITHIASTDSQRVIWMKGGVAAAMRNEPHPQGGWAPGTPPLPDRAGLLVPVQPGEDVHIFKTDMAGWYDLFLQGSINDWLAWKESGKAVLVIGAGAHGPHPRPFARAA